MAFGKDVPDGVFGRIADYLFHSVTPLRLHYKKDGLMFQVDPYVPSYN